MNDINQIAEKLAGGLSLEMLRQKQAGIGIGTTFETRPKTPEEIERDAKYTATWKDGPQLTSVPRPRTFKLEMPYEKARAEFWKIMLRRAEHIATNEGNPDFKWIFSDGDKANLKNLVKWVINDPSGDLPINKGLYIYGSSGTGKSEIIQALCEFSEQFEMNKSLAFSVMSEIYTKAKIEKGYDPIAPHLQFDRVFDEFGLFTGPVSIYGDPLDINQAIIEQRERRWKRYGQMTVLISNGSKEQIKSLFSTMLFDRIRSFTTEVHFEGDSKRI